MLIKKSVNYSLSKVLLLLICALYIVLFTGSSVFAAPLSESELEALGEYPNWVASSSCTSSSTTPTTYSFSTSANAHTAFDYFLSQGLSAAAAAGLVGNFQVESGPELDTSADNGTHFGIAQWSAGRWATLQSVESGTSLTDQLNFIMYELNSDYKANTLAPLKQTSDPSQAADIVDTNYEVPANPPESVNDPSYPKRVGNAVNLYNLYGKDASTVAVSTQSSYGSSGSGDSGSCSGSSTSATSTNTQHTSGASGWDLSGTNAMVYFGQCDPSWGSQPYGNPGQSSICEGGCGITSLAMVIDTLANVNETPLTLAKKYGATYHQDGTSWALWPVAAKDYNLKEEDIGTNFSDAAQTLKAGGLVIAAFSPGFFTSVGHVMVLREVTSDGKFYLADPNNAGNTALGNTNNTAYSSSYLLSPGNLENMWAFTK